MRTRYQDRIHDLLDQDGDYLLLEPLSPLGGPLTPEPRARYHADTCYCESCADIRAAQEIYYSRKRAAEGGGFGW